MITREELDNFYLNENGGNGSTCWHCRKKISGTETEFQISNTDNGYYIRFHQHCFKEIAGDKYIIET